DPEGPNPIGQGPGGGSPGPQNPQGPEIDDAQLAGSLRLSPYLVTVRKPKALSEQANKGLKWLTARQNTHSGGGQGVQGAEFGRFGGQGAQQFPDPSNLPDTCMATLALVRAGGSPKSGEFAKPILKAIDFVCTKVENADADSLNLNPPPKNTGTKAMP